MIRYAPLLAALLGFSGVALGAFGAHGLRDVVRTEWLEVWKTAVSYQMYHVPLIFMLPFASMLNARWRQRAMLFWVPGVLIFSGSLYLLVALNLPWLGMVTPVGGVCLLLGWLCLCLAAIKRN